MAANSKKVVIRARAYDHKILDTWCAKVVEAAKSTGALVSGPVPLPTKIEKYTVLRSPHTDKKSREQFEIRTHKRVIYLAESSSTTIDTIDKVIRPKGLEVSIKI